MDQQINMQPLGPDGVRQRMDEIRAKMQQVLGAPDSPAPSFASTLASKVSGPIGDASPLDPLGAGMKLEGGKPTPDIENAIKNAAQSNNIDPNLLDALVDAESSYDPTARSRAGAMGLSQLMPETARDMGVTNPFDPAQNVHGGAKYLSGLINKYHGDIKLALAAYNAGPGAVDRAGGVPHYPETQAYVQRVLRFYQQRKSA
jgi:soluble lytic murein transglycosylase-like protein